MTELLLSNLEQYGCFAIFILVGLQEVGLPNPIPNEFVLLFSGYLAYKGLLYFPLLIVAAILGDMIASITLFTLFYFFGKIILNRKPKWLTLRQSTKARIFNKINNEDSSGVFIGRLTPFIKGYVSVLSGLVHFSPKKYFGILLSTSFIWVIAYTTIGYYFGFYWNFENQSNFSLIMIGIAIIFTGIYIVNFCIKRNKTVTK